MYIKYTEHLAPPTRSKFSPFHSKTSDFVDTRLWEIGNASDGLTMILNI